MSDLIRTYKVAIDETGVANGDGKAAKKGTIVANGKNQAKKESGRHFVEVQATSPDDAYDQLCKVFRANDDRPLSNKSVLSRAALVIPADVKPADQVADAVDAEVASKLEQMEGANGEMGTPAGASDLTKEAMAAVKASKPKAPRKVKEASAGEVCRCGCDEITKGGKFIPGHDARLYGQIKRVLHGELALADASRKVAKAIANAEVGHGVFAPTHYWTTEGRQVWTGQVGLDPATLTLAPEKPKAPRPSNPNAKRNQPTQAAKSFALMARMALTLDHVTDQTLWDLHKEHGIEAMAKAKELQPSIQGGAPVEASPAA